MTTQDGQGQGERPRYEGVVLPPGGESLTPEQQRATPPLPAGPPPAGQPSDGAPWGQPWGPTAAAEGPAAPADHWPAAPPLPPSEGGWAPGAPQAQPQPPSWQDGEATTMMPPVSAAEGPDADATRAIPRYQGPPADAEATQLLPPQHAQQHPPQHARQPSPPDAGPEATTRLRALPPEAAALRTPQPQPQPQPPAHAGPGEPPQRPLYAEFDSLFRADPQPPRQAPPQEAGHTQALPPVPPVASPGERRSQPGWNVPLSRDTGGEGRPPRGVLVGAGVAVVVTIGLLAGAVIGGGDGEDPEEEDPPRAAGSAPASPGDKPSPAADPAEEQAKELDALLEKSNNSRTAVIRSVENIKKCTELPKAAADLRAAAKQREGLVTSLAGLETGELPDSAALNSALTKAWKASARADDAYAAWADQTAGKNGCRGGAARNTRQAQLGNRASGEASAAKKEAADLWNPTAREYGLTERAVTDL